jgi:hypothetical protein
MKIYQKTATIILSAIIAVLFLLTQKGVAGIVEDALNLPELKHIKNSGVKVESVNIPDVTDSNGHTHTVLGQTDGNKITLNSKVYNNSSDKGAVAQVIVHEYTHIDKKHEGNCKENELDPRKNEAKFWRDYKKKNPGASNAACDANEKLIYNGSKMRSDADIKKDVHDDYGYPDDPDGKEKSDAVYSVEEGSSGFDLDLVSGETEIIVGDDSAPITVAATGGTAHIVLNELKNISENSKYSA